MNLFEFIHDDHERIHKDLEKIAEQLRNPRKDAASLRELRHSFLALKRDLLVHMLAEEEAVYNQLRLSPTLKLYSFEGDEQHEIIHTLLDKLEDEVIDLDGRWEGTFIVMKEMIARHVDMEEREVFREMKVVFPPEQLKLMTAQMKEEKLIVSESLHNACLDRDSWADEAITTSGASEALSLQ